MRYIIGMRRALISIGRSSLVVSLALAVGCSSKNCVRKHDKGKVNPQTLLTSKDAFTETLYCSNNPNPYPKKVKKLKRVAKVEESKQAIVLLHGLHRLSYDFATMQAVLKEKFPHASILASTSLNKDPNKKGMLSSFDSPTTSLCIRKQAESVYKEIKDMLPGKHVVIIGHSQGGLRGFVLVKEYRCCLKQEGIDINHLITIGTPWKGAPVMDHIKDINAFKKEFAKIEPTLDKIQENYGKDVIRYFFKFKPELAKKWPNLYSIAVTYFMSKICPGAAALEPGSDFISRYVALGLQEVDIPITAIAGVLSDFSSLFDPFPSSISSEALNKLNATYASLISGNEKSEHDMLLPVDTQHAEGCTKKNFKCIKVYGACHGNKVGRTVKKGISELNNKEVIQNVVESIEATFYENREEVCIENPELCSPAA